MTIPNDHFRQAIQHTPFHARLAAMTQTEEWTVWNGCMAPRVLDKLSTEYFAVRSSCSVMDMSPMEKYRITGTDAYRFLDRLLTRDLSSLRPGRVTYVVWCNDEGKLIDDGTLFQFGDGDYRLCSQHHQFDWLMTSSIGFDVNIEVETHDVAALAVQGPTSYSVLTEAGIAGLDELRPFGIANLSCRDFPVVVSRTGYTGDLGYELCVSPDNALQLWDAIFDVKSCYDVHAMGLSTLEMVRIEAGFIMPGFDFNTAESTVRADFDRSPYEVGLGWVVNLDKGQFTGRNALVAENKRPAKRRLTKITIEGNKPVGEAFIYDKKGGKLVGEIKCATWSPILKANIALADIEYISGALPRELWAKIDYQRELKWMSAWAECQATNKPFYSPDHRSATPPGRF